MERRQAHCQECRWIDWEEWHHNHICMKLYYERYSNIIRKQELYEYFAVNVLFVGEVDSTRNSNYP